MYNGQRSLSTRCCSRWNLEDADRATPRSDRVNGWARGRSAEYRRQETNIDCEDVCDAFIGEFTKIAKSGRMRMYAMMLE
jgi:hypothetical protein